MNILAKQNTTMLYLNDLVPFNFSFISHFVQFRFKQIEVKHMGFRKELRGTRGNLQ